MPPHFCNTSGILTEVTLDVLYVRVNIAARRFVGGRREHRAGKWRHQASLSKRTYELILRLKHGGIFDFLVRLATVERKSVSVAGNSSKFPPPHPYWCVPMEGCSQEPY